MALSVYNNTVQYITEQEKERSIVQQATIYYKYTIMIKIMEASK